MSNLKIAVLAKLHDYGGDFARQWFVYFSYRDPATGKMKRFKDYAGFASCVSPAARYEHAEKAVLAVNQKIKAGWSPFDQEPEAIYQDSIVYHLAARKYGSARKLNFTWRFYLSQYLTDIAKLP